MIDHQEFGPGPLVDYPDGYFRTIPADFDVPLEHSDIPYFHRVYNRSGTIMGEVQRLTDAGVLTIRLLQSPHHVTGDRTHLYALFSGTRYVAQTDD